MEQIEQEPASASAQFMPTVRGAGNAINAATCTTRHFS